MEQSHIASSGLRSGLANTTLEEGDRYVSCAIRAVRMYYKYFLQKNKRKKRKSQDHY